MLWSYRCIRLVVSEYGMYTYVCVQHMHLYVPKISLVQQNS